MLRLILLGLLGMIVVPVQAATIGYINYAKIMQNAPQIKASRELLDKQFVPERNRLVALRKQLETQRKKLAEMGPGANPYERASRIEKLNNTVRSLRKLERDYNISLSLRTRQLSTNFAELVRRVIKVYAEQHDEIIVIRGGVLYAAPRIDITDAILQQIRAVYRKAQTEGKK